MTTKAKLVTVVALLLTVVCLCVSAVAVQGRSDALARERASETRTQAALDRMPGRGPMGQRVASAEASEREAALRAYFDSGVLGDLTRVGSVAIARACALAGSGEPISDPARTARDIVEEEAATTDLPALADLPGDEWHALLETDLVEAELARCGA